MHCIYLLLCTRRRHNKIQSKWFPFHKARLPKGNMFVCNDNGKRYKTLITLKDELQPRPGNPSPRKHATGVSRRLEQANPPCHAPVSMALKWENITMNKCAIYTLLIFSEVGN